MQDGQMINDGSVKWQICDTRISFPVGYFIHDRVLRPGFIKVNKATILRSDFIRLYKWANDNGLIIAETLKNSDIKYSSFFGTGNGSTTFSLPDERGTAERGWDDGRGLDADRQLGTYQADAIQDIVGQFGIQTVISGANNNYNTSTAVPGSASGVFTKGGYAYSNTSQIAQTGLSNPYNFYSSVVFSAANVARTASETRIRNIAKIAQIKY